MTSDEVVGALGSHPNGLGNETAAARLARYGPNALPGRGGTAWGVLARQFANPVLVLLLLAAGLSFATGDRGNAIVIVLIMAGSTALGSSTSSAPSAPPSSCTGRSTTVLLSSEKGASGRCRSRSSWWAMWCAWDWAASYLQICAYLKRRSCNVMKRC